jgi:hypothetical protein
MLFSEGSVTIYIHHTVNTTSLDTTTLASFDSKVKQFSIMIVLDTFDELMLCTMICVHCHFKKYIRGSKLANVVVSEQVMSSSLPL